MTTPTPMMNTPQKQAPASSSPAPRSVPAMVNFDSPAAFGLLAEGGVGMGISMSGMGMSSLGFTASAMGRADEDERRRRLQSIISTLKSRPGRVGPKGILDLCQTEGLSAVEESGVLVLQIGNESLCEIPVRNGEVVPEEVALGINGDEHDYAATASKILGDSLKPLPGMAKINVSLERFAHNLEKLLRIDHLSGPQNGGLSCYKAIFGVYTSLKKLFDHEKKAAMALRDSGDPLASYKAEREVLCKKSGRPRLNAGGRLGLSLEYWMDRRHVLPSHGKGKEAMDIDSQPANNNPEDDDTKMHQIYALTLECESAPASPFSSIRISDAWISDTVEKAPDAPDSDITNLLLNKPTLDWQDPPPTYLPSALPEGEHEALNLDNATGRLPNIRFVAKLSPPLVVPLLVFNYIQQSLNFGTSNDIRVGTFADLALKAGDPDPAMTGAQAEPTYEMRAEKKTLVLGEDGKEEEHRHDNWLYFPRTDYCVVIDSLPFSHPRQLVELLPTLRQYAFTTSLLSQTFGGTAQSLPSTKQPPSSGPRSQSRSKQNLGNDQKEPAVRLDVSVALASNGGPQLRVDIPAANAGSLSADDILACLTDERVTGKRVTLVVDVQSNADLVIKPQNLPTNGTDTTMSDNDKDEKQNVQQQDASVKRLARALEVCMDLGIWVEWVKKTMLAEGR
ncbi:hypothetical protein M011DRAFT_397750 [Sporormia fimetaria CBS 119925]|uniref:Mediator of RNA polymerase II transcription subunit 1 n=1 Tax=Sporormia fimetaria CBS 119925 TaxID=1340428 RepID=A0A6A6VJY2_9PLEO|nr:hypothetical protein M011DRAFT_397750 [Sporormia fimetaria CBS 119925]